MSTKLTQKTALVVAGDQADLVDLFEEFLVCCWVPVSTLDAEFRRVRRRAAGEPQHVVCNAFRLEGTDPSLAGRWAFSAGSVNSRRYGVVSGLRRRAALRSAAKGA